MNKDRWEKDKENKMKVYIKKVRREGGGDGQEVKGKTFSRQTTRKGRGNVKRNKEKKNEGRYEPCSITLGTITTWPNPGMVLGDTTSDL
jgi:hypothetical protein